MYRLLKNDSVASPFLQLDKLGNTSDTTLSETAAPIMREAAEYTDCTLFDDFNSRVRDVNAVTSNPNLGFDFLWFASRRARALGDTEPAERFALGALSLARQTPRDHQTINVFDARDELQRIQAQVGDAPKAEKTLKAAVATLGREKTRSVAPRIYLGHFTLAALQARQGKFTTALRSAQSARNISSDHETVQASQAVIGEKLIPELEAVLQTRGDNGQPLTREEEAALWRQVESATEEPHGFFVERPLTPEEHRTYSYLLDPTYLPSIDEVKEAYDHDRQAELVNRYFRSGRPGERYELWTRESIENLAQYIVSELATAPHVDGRLRVLEVGAGEARLSAFVSQAMERQGSDFRLWASDPGADHISAIFPVDKLDYREALAKYDPHVVISSWMPRGSDWTPDFRQTKSVQAYILIGSRSVCATLPAWQQGPAKADGFTLHNLEEFTRLKTVPHPYAIDGHSDSRITRAFVRQT